MVQAIVNINEHTNRVLNIVKAKFDLKDKSEAIDVMARQYEQTILEPPLRPEYAGKLGRIKKEKGVRFKNVEELDAYIKKNA